MDTLKNKTGKLKIGNNWNAIKIIALSQNNPLKAIAEFVENSIDAKSKNITIIRGKYKGEHFLKIIDDGEGINDFHYVATHIGDSIKRQLKKKGEKGIQGEFGIGLLSFWTVGEELEITSTGKDKITKKMKLVKNNPGYSILPVRTLFDDHKGTVLYIKSILPGIRQLNGEKIQNYLASELRDRINKTNVKIKIIDRTSRKELIVEPRKFKGRLLHNLPEIHNPIGEIYAELYISEPNQDNQVGLYKLGTRVLPSITNIDYFKDFPWTSGYLEGIIDASFLHLTPGTRDGIIYDNQLESFCNSMDSTTEVLGAIINEQKKAEEEKASKNILQKVKKAIKEAFLLLPKEEYQWLDISEKKNVTTSKNEKVTSDNTIDTALKEEATAGIAEKTTLQSEVKQKNFFEFPGPLYKVIISPSSIIISTNEKKKLRIIARDKHKRQIDSDILIQWNIKEGEGSIDNKNNEMIEFTAPEEPGLTILEAEVTQGDIVCKTESIITITDELIPKKDQQEDIIVKNKGLPGYTYKRSPGELWRSKYDPINNLIIINNGHADFIYASKVKTRKLKYITRLYAKELVLVNFPELNKEKLMEKMIELILYTEENLK